MANTGFEPSSATSTVYGRINRNTLVEPRTGSVQLTSLIVTSSSFGATQAATLLEVANTLIAAGLWKGAA